MAHFKGYRYWTYYDGLDRLTSSTYSTWSGGSSFGTSGAYGESATYDANGNILTLQRRNQSGGLVDNLTYNYQTGRNRLSSINDAAGAPTSWDAGSTYYWYNPVGALDNFWDVGRNVESYLMYDERAMPVSYDRHDYNQMSTLNISYRYNADGQRYWKKLQGGSGTFYAMDGAVNVGVIDESWSGGHWNILGPGGEVLGRHPRSISEGRRYYVKDHLGSVRVELRDDGAVAETRDHYPFGLEMPGRSTDLGTKAKPATNLMMKRASCTQAPATMTQRLGGS